MTMLLSALLKKPSVCLDTERHLPLLSRFVEATQEALSKVPWPTMTMVLRMWQWDSYSQSTVRVLG